MARLTNAGVRRAVGRVLAVVPLMFGVLRASTTGTDFRYLWVAAATLVVALLILTGARRGGPAITLGRLLVAVIGAMAVAAAVAFALGAGSLPAVLAVAFGFAICCSVGLALAIRPPR